MNLYPGLVKSYFQTTLGALLHHLKLEIFLHTSVILHIFQPPSLSVYSLLPPQPHSSFVGSSAWSIEKFPLCQL